MNFNINTDIKCTRIWTFHPEENLQYYEYVTALQDWLLPNTHRVN